MKIPYLLLVWEDLNQITDEEKQSRHRLQLLKMCLTEILKIKRLVSNANIFRVKAQESLTAEGQKKTLCGIRWGCYGSLELVDPKLLLKAR